MTRQEYIEKIFETYQLVTVLADKNNCRTLRLRHKELKKDLVLHSFPRSFGIYESLCEIVSPNLPEVYDAITLDDGQLILEEFVDGATVAEIMEGGKIRLRGAKKILSEVCNALSVIHSQGFVHRDVKPENILVNKTGRVVLIDFNASRKITNARQDTEILGTVGYASPEQLGVSHTDERTDIYAAGVLLNVMVTGKHPSETLPKGRVGRIIRKCTNVNPNDRYQTAQQLSKAL